MLVLLWFVGSPIIYLSQVGSLVVDHYQQVEKPSWTPLKTYLLGVFCDSIFSGGYFDARSRIV